MSRKWAEVLVFTVFLVAVGVVGLVSLDEIVKRSERAECLIWKQQASHNSAFYLVGWQADQCQAVGVSVDGIPVRR